MVSRPVRPWDQMETDPTIFKLVSENPRPNTLQRPWKLLFDAVLDNPSNGNLDGLGSNQRRIRRFLLVFFLLF
jgi:hypothetical protein